MKTHRHTFVLPSPSHAYSLYSSRYGNFTTEDTLTVIKASQQTAAPSQTCRQVFPQERGNDAPEGGEAGRKWQKIGDAELTARQTQECGALELFISLFPFPGRTHHTPTTPYTHPLSLFFPPIFAACYKLPHLQPIREDTRIFGCGG